MEAESRSSPKKAMLGVLLDDHGPLADHPRFSPSPLRAILSCDARILAAGLGWGGALYKAEDCSSGLHVIERVEQGDNE